MLIRLEFPKYNADKLNEWLYKSNQYFEYDQTIEETKVKITSIHLDGKALR